MKIAPYTADHLAWLSLQPVQHGAMIATDPHTARLLEDTVAYTVLRDGAPVACAGLLLIDPGFARLWSAISKDARPAMLGLHRIARDMLAAERAIRGLRRVEAVVDAGFDPAHRWLTMLGFEIEAPLMLKALPDGRDASLYARVEV